LPDAGAAPNAVATSSPAPHGDPGRFDREIKAEQLRMFCQQAIRIPFGVAILAGYILYLFWNHVRHDALILWVVVVCGALLVRTYLSAKLLRRELTSDEVAYWMRFMIFFSLLNGAFGGSAGIFFFPAAPLTEKALLTMLIAAWCAAAIATSGMMPRSFYMFAVPLVAPITIGWWYVDEHWFNAILLVAFLIYMVLYVRDAGRLFLGALQTRYENAALVGELRAKQEEAEVARDRAENASRAKTQFLAAASHDLRQPLTALALFNRLLTDAARDPETKRIAAQIDSSVSSLDSLMSALLDISKLDAGTIQPSRVPVALAPIFERLEEQYRPVAAEKKLRFTAAANDLWVDTDPVLFERIVRNLVENALRYTAQGSIAVRATRAVDCVVVEVIDTGIGIPLQERARIFEEFYQIRNTERDAHQGLGLGLAIVQRIARLLDCNVEVESMLDYGSTFRVKVPRAEPRQAEVAALPRRELERPDLAGLKILVVDDEAAITAAMQGLLQCWGCEVSVAGAVASATANLSASERPDLIIVDFRLRNGETGIDVVRAANERFGRVPAILVTGDTAPDRLREAAESGLGLMHKPISADALREQIERVLELT
jgi:signal transduction histidine kinase